MLEGEPVAELVQELLRKWGSDQANHQQLQFKWMIMIHMLKDKDELLRTEEMY